MINKKVWIDTDLSVGMKRHHKEGYCDVDDGFAVLQLIKAENVKIYGISAVFGNTLLDNAYDLCKQMSADFAQGEIPVYKGAAEGIKLNDVQTNEAVEALAKTLREQKLIVMAIGPATNVGLLLLKYPELASQIEEVVFVAGRRKPTDFFEIGDQGRRAQDLNFDLDNNAFRIVFENKVKVVLCPFEISSKVWVKQEDLDILSKGDAGNKWLAQHSQAWLEQWLSLGAKGFNPFDVLASHYIIAPEDIVLENLNAHLEIHPDDTVGDKQNQVFKNYLLCDDSAGFPVTYCYDISSNYHDKLIATLQ